MLYTLFRNNLNNLILTIICSLLILRPSFALSYSQELIIGTYNSPPFSMQEDGENIGLATEVVKSLLHKSGVNNFTINYYPVMRGLFELKNDRIDIYYPYIPQFSEHNKDFILIGPISRYRVALFVRKDYNQDVSLKAMHNLAVGAERGSIGDLVLQHMNMRVEQASQEISCLTMVLAQRISACAMGTLPGMYSAAINNIYQDLRYVETEQYADMYIALRPNLPDNLIKKIQKTFALLKKQNYFDIQQRDYEKKFAMFINTLS